MIQKYQGGCETTVRTQVGRGRRIGSAEMLTCTTISAQEAREKRSVVKQIKPTNRICKDGTVRLQLLQLVAAANRSAIEGLF